MKKGRTRKQLRLDSKGHYRGLAERNPAASAARQMIHKAYQSYTVDQYVRKKESEAVGQKKAESV